MAKTSRNWSNDDGCKRSAAAACGLLLTWLCAACAAESRDEAAVHADPEAATLLSVADAEGAAAPEQVGVTQAALTDKTFLGVDAERVRANLFVVKNGSG